MPVDHRPAESRYLFSVDGEQVGLTDYLRQGEAIHLTHTEIDPHRRNTGLGEQMVGEVLDLIREETSHRVVPACPFVAAFLQSHPEYADLTTR